MVVTDPFRLRFSIYSENSARDAAPWQLYVSKNGGAYQATTTTSDYVKSVDAGASADETAILVPRLTLPSAVDTSLWMADDNGTFITQDDGTQIVVANNS